MILQYLHLLAIILLLIFLIFISFNTIFLVYSFLSGAPFVSSTKKELEKVFKIIKIRKNQIVYDLGCGDGTVLFYLIKRFQCHGVGIDINPWLLLKAKLYSKICGFEKLVIFYKTSLTKCDFKNADVIYIYLLPKLVLKLKDKLINDTKSGSLIVSHGFKIDYIENWRLFKITGTHHPTYIYKKPKKLV